MPRKQVLIAGASGLVGYAAMRHFGADPDAMSSPCRGGRPTIRMARAFCPWT
jgi:hypothetical protein